MIAHNQFDSNITCVCIRKTNDFFQVIIATICGDIFAWDLPLEVMDLAFDSQSEPRLFQNHPSEVSSICLNKNQTKLGSCSVDGLIQVNDMKTGMNLFNKKLNSTPVSLSWNENDYLMNVNNDGFIYIWDLVQVKLYIHVQIFEG